MMNKCKLFFKTTMRSAFKYKFYTLGVAGVGSLAGANLVFNSAAAEGCTHPFGWMFEKVESEEEKKKKMIKYLNDNVDFKRILSENIMYQKTEKIDTNIKNGEDALVFEYDESFKFGTEQHKMLEHPAIYRFSPKIYIREILQLLFTTDDSEYSLLPNVNIFDYVILQYYHVPIVVGKNANPKKYGYSLIINVPMLRTQMNASIKEELMRMPRNF